MHCKICAAPARETFRARVLSKYDTAYFQCPACGFLAPEGCEEWLPEAYSSAITSLDLGLLKRNLELREVVAAIVRAFFRPGAKFVDYGGGYGVLVRLLRDRGLDFYRQDVYAENLFAKNFEWTDAGTAQFELLTAFEVFEHLADPAVELQKMLEFSDNILFSTELQPHPNPTPDSWWYILPEIGQHVALFSRRSLAVLAERHGLHFYTNGKNLHLLCRQKLEAGSWKIAAPLLFRALSYHQISRVFNAALPGRRSLLQADFDMIRAKIGH